MSQFSRKDFLRISALASATLMIPKFLRGENTESKNALDRLFLPATNGKRLIVVQLTGGNDGLNMVVPYGDDVYHSNRPTVGIKSAQVLRMNDYFGFNPGMTGVHDLYNSGQFAILNAVGYDNPNRSHFRSLDIWHSASDADRYIQSGWIGRWLDANNTGDTIKPHLAVEIDDAMSLALKGNTVKGIGTRNPKRMRLLTEDQLLMQIANDYKHHESDHSLVDYLHKSLSETSQSAGYLIEKSKAGKPKAIYPQHAFGKQMKTVAELILGGSETAIYYVSLPGFDTHAGQNGQQNRLLKVFSEAIDAFSKDMKDAGLWNETLIMTFSEFGRRVKQNASQGTDHGTANVVMLSGGSLKNKGVLNEAADLSNLNEGDLIHKLDFRQVYATILQNWLGTEAEIVLGRKFGLLNFV